MQDSIEKLFAYIQERCLWQFHSRAWDREQNISSILAQTAALLTGVTLDTPTLADRAHYAEAKVLANDLTTQFPWVKTLTKEQTHTLFEEVREKLTALTITKSLNAELHHPNY